MLFGSIGPACLAWPGLPTCPSSLPQASPVFIPPSCPCPQVAERVRVDPRVRVLERTNLRSLRLADLGCPPLDIVTLDLSFISVIKMVDAVGGWVGGASGLFCCACSLCPSDRPSLMKPAARLPACLTCAGVRCAGAGWRAGGAHQAAV
jgi:hypothetical protein